MKKVIIATFIAAMMTTTAFACDAPATNYCTTCGYVWAYCQCGGGGKTYYNNGSCSSGNGNVYVYGNNYGVINNYSYVNNGYDYSVNYYDNDSYTEYAEYDGSYCLLCGLDWDTCTCYDVVDVYPYEYGDDCYQQYSYGNCGEYDEYDKTTCYYYDCSTYSESVYSECSTQMCHWANLRDECGNIIGVVDAGANVEICGPCADNPSRTIIYDYATGCYGTVASVYIYGGTDYEYQNPNEWRGCYQQQWYDETTPWACDNPNWIEANGCGYSYEECSYNTYGYDDCAYQAIETDYTECYDEVIYSDDDCGMYFLNNGIIANSNIEIKIDLSNSVINIYSGDEVLLSGNCDCSGLASGNYYYCADFAGYCGSFGSMIPEGCQICVRG